MEGKDALTIALGVAGGLLLATLLLSLFRSLRLVPPPEILEVEKPREFTF